MKKLLLILPVIFLIGLFIFFGVHKDNKSVDKNINILKNLDSYSCRMDVTVKNDKQDLKYSGVQKYKKSLGYRLEIDKKRTLIYKKDKIYINDLNNGFKYAVDKDFDNIYKLSFIGEYIGLLYTNEEIKSYFKNVDGIEYQVIEVIIPNINRNIHKGVLYLNVKDAVPETLTIYDKKDNERIKVEYKDFILNEEIDDKQFNVEKKGGE